ncbi:AraC family transcriptional regulator [Nostoc sp. NIES-2111]
MSSDTISDVLKAVRLTGAVFFDCSAGENFVAETLRKEAVLPRMLTGADHLIAYHMVTQGSCFAAIIGERPIRVNAGEVIIFTRGEPHVLSSSPGMRAAPVPPSTVDVALASRLPFIINYGDEDRRQVRFVCGFLACDASPFNPLLGNLPSVLKVGAGQGWKALDTLIGLAIEESSERKPGGESVLAKLSELMFVEALRRHLAELPEASSGWLAGLKDPVVGRALACLHSRPAENWTLEKLAAEIFSSRSVLADRFARLVGVPPMTYLGRWRMQLASGLLRSSHASVAAVAAQVGYTSEEAFSRAFSRTVGMAPSAWRKS